MTFASLFAGIGGFDLGFERAGMNGAFQCEFDPQCGQVLTSRFPKARLEKDVRTVRAIPTVDVLCGGFPCQDLSVAGRRAGLSGERSGLWFEFLRIIGEARPRTVVIENVPGLLSSNGGRDFAVVLSGLVQHGYRVAWRVLDSQWFGVAQRRRRVFIVGSLGDGRCAEILFEPESLLGHPAPSRETGKEVAGALGGGSGKRGWCNDLNGNGAFVAGTLNASGVGTNRPAGQCNELDFLIPIHPHCIGRGPNSGPQGKEYLEDGSAYCHDSRGVSQAVAVRTAQTSANGHGVSEEASHTLDGANAQAVCQVQWASGGGQIENDTAQALRSNAEVNYQFARIGYTVRRLTPTECARLQGFPDDWLEGLGLSDSAKYRMLGNAVTVNVSEWIGRRIVASLEKERAA